MSAAGTRRLGTRSAAGHQPRPIPSARRSKLCERASSLQLRSTVLHLSSLHREQQAAKATASHSHPAVPAQASNHSSNLSHDPIPSTRCAADTESHHAPDPPSAAAHGFGGPPVLLCPSCRSHSARPAPCPSSGSSLSLAVGPAFTLLAP